MTLEAWRIPMDPKATLERLRAAYMINDRDEIEEASDDLIYWLHKGGFAPSLSNRELTALLMMVRGYARIGKTVLQSQECGGLRI